MLRKIKLSFFLIVILAASTFAQQAESFTVNGLKVILKQNTSNDIVAVSLVFKGGTTILEPNQAGIEALTLNVALKASENYPKDKLNAELESMATQLGASSSLDYSSINMQCVKQNFENSWNILSDVVPNPSFTQEDFKLEREQFISGAKQAEDNADSYLQKIFRNGFYGDHPYSIEVNGTENTLNSFTVEQLKDFFSERKTTSQMLLVVVGNTSRSELEPMVADAFGSLPVGEFKMQIPPSTSFSEPSIKIVHRELPTNYIQSSYSAPVRTTDEGYTMNITSSILRDRVWEEVRTKRSLSYAITSRYGNALSNYAAIYVTAVDADSTVKVMINELQKLMDELISARELENKKRQFITFYYLGNETNQSQAGVLTRFELSGAGFEEADKFIDKLMKVTPEDIQSVANKYMNNLQFVLIGDPESLEVKNFMY
ncbi:MAG: insulinase family protein [Ignavibacterium sp.]|nr:MAG: insulinase family protein [Ignavibacterium sp.]